MRKIAHPMVNKIISSFQKILSKGVLPEMSEPELRRTRLFNFFYLVGTFIFLCVIIETFLAEGMYDGIKVLIGAVIFQIGAIPLFTNRRKIAELYFLLIGNLILLVFNNMYGRESGIYYYYYPYVIFIAFLVDFKKPTQLIIHSLITFLFILIAFFTEHQFLYIKFNEKITSTSNFVNFVLATLMMACLAAVIVRMMNTQYKYYLKRLNERAASEELMRISIKEKETLLAEVHHRVKNNLAVISGLLNLQMNNVKNEYTRNVLRESRNRVSSMALIHQKLYRNTNVEEIDFGEYVGELVNEIQQSYPDFDNDSVEIKLDIEHLSLSLTKAIPSGLILNELLSNCYKHAFHGRNAGTIAIRFKKLNQKYFLQVEDNGVGLSGDFNWKNHDSLGMTIIQSLSDQIDAETQILGDRGTGTSVTLVFSDN